MRGNRIIIVVVALVIVIVVAAGCGDECNDGESVCDGNRIYGCHEGSLVSGEGCCPQGATCIQLGDEEMRTRHVACSRTNALDPRCDGVVGRRDICVGNLLVQCDFELSRGERACESECVVKSTQWSGDWGYCVVAATDVRCVGWTKDRPIGCDGNVKFYCDRGSLVEEVDCAALGAECRADAELESAACFAPPDPVCMEPKPPYAFCDGLLKKYCTTDGQRMTVDACPADRPCEDYGLAVGCASPTRCE